MNYSNTQRLYLFLLFSTSALGVDQFPNAGFISPDGRIWSVAKGAYITDSAIVSLTTVPGREETLRQTLSSLLEQTERVPIFLALPRRSIRFASSPYTVPGWLLDMNGVHVHRCEDMGPATKILAAVDFIAAITNTSVRIVTVDDDLVPEAACTRSARTARAAAAGRIAGGRASTRPHTPPPPPISLPPSLPPRRLSLSLPLPRSLATSLASLLPRSLDLPRSLAPSLAPSLPRFLSLPLSLSRCLAASLPRCLAHPCILFPRTPTSITSKQT